MALLKIEIPWFATPSGYFCVSNLVSGFLFLVAVPLLVTYRLTPPIACNIIKTGVHDVTYRKSDN